MEQLSFYFDAHGDPEITSEWLCYVDHSIRIQWIQGNRGIPKGSAKWCSSNDRAVEAISVLKRLKDIPRLYEIARPVISHGDHNGYNVLSNVYIPQPELILKEMFIAYFAIDPIEKRKW